MIKLHVPTIEELSYREKLLKDKETMKYNAGYELEVDNYDSETGCIYFSKEYHLNWYNKWINNPDRFYAYIEDESINAYVGEVSFRYNKELDGYMIGILIENKYRGNGYAKESLKILIEKIFNEYEPKDLYDDIPSIRKESIQLFKKLGFEVNDIYSTKKFNVDEEIYLMKLNKKKYTR